VFLSGVKKLSHLIEKTLSIFLVRDSFTTEGHRVAIYSCGHEP
jgi:hypothetical protein